MTAAFDVELGVVGLRGRGYTYTGNAFLLTTVFFPLGQCHLGRMIVGLLLTRERNWYDQNEALYWRMKHPTHGRCSGIRLHDLGLCNPVDYHLGVD